MRVNVRTSRPFYGVIHTRDQRTKAPCFVEGNGDTEYFLDISHTLNPQDPQYCGVLRAPREHFDDKDVLSVVLAVRVDRRIQLSEDKFFLLNCTNRCKRADCSRMSENIVEEPAGESESFNATLNNADSECNIYKLPWALALLWCMGILLLAMMISHCILCSSLVCRCVKTEVEEREPSVYEGATDTDDDLQSATKRIDYDNKDIYKTSNNYAPYSLEDAQAKSRRHKHSRRL